MLRLKSLNLPFRTIIMKCFLLIYLVLLLTSNISAQIVNIESNRYTTDTTGWKGNYEMSLALGKQKDKYFAFGNIAHVQYKSKKSLYLILGSIYIIKSDKEKLVNSGFFHFRYNYKIKNWLRWEAFTQVQYNKLIGLRMRFLVGTGPRFKVVQVEKFKTYIGTLYMLEYEINNDKTEKLLQGRFSTYLSFSFRPIKSVEIISTTYYQPLFSQLYDYRISTENAFNFKFHKNISFGLNFRLQYDTRPPLGATTQITYLLENKIKLDF